ncbi:MAG: type IV pilin protein [Pirellulales bacterium]
MVAQLRLCRRRPVHSPPQRAGARRAPRGMTFVEVLTVVVLLGILFSMAAPRFSHTVEQAHADVAGANLRAVWSAERFYWLENRTYTTNLAALEALGLLDPSIVAGTSRYSFSIASANDASLTAVATRINSGLWSGSFQIDETGVVGGVVQALGHSDITPGFN